MHCLTLTTSLPDDSSYRPPHLGSPGTVQGARSYLNFRLYARPRILVACNTNISRGTFISEKCCLSENQIELGIFNWFFLFGKTGNPAPVLMAKKNEPLTKEVTRAKRTPGRRCRAPNPRPTEARSLASCCRLLIRPGSFCHLSAASMVHKMSPVTTLGQQEETLSGPAKKASLQGEFL